MFPSDVQLLQNSQETVTKFPSSQWFQKQQEERNTCLLQQDRDRLQLVYLGREFPPFKISIIFKQKQNNHIMLLEYRLFQIQKYLNIPQTHFKFLIIINLMVLIIYKKTEKNTFAVECSTEIKVSTLLTKLIEINNLRVYLDRLIWSVQQLANKGVLKPPDLQGVSWQDFQKNEKQFEHLPQQVKLYGRKPIAQPPNRYIPDKHHQRYGIILSEELKQLMLSAVTKAKEALQFKGEITVKEKLVQAVQGLRNSVMEAYPGYLDLPEWEPTLLMLQEKVELEILQTQTFQVFDQRSIVWWAGKSLESDKIIGQYFGKNEKTKAIVKIQKWGGQQPLREPPVDSETYKKMVSYYYKKVEQSKQIEKKSVETHYEKLETQDLKAKLHLSEEIRFKPF